MKHLLPAVSLTSDRIRPTDMGEMLMGIISEQGKQCKGIKSGRGSAIFSNKVRVSMPEIHATKRRLCKEKATLRCKNLNPNVDII